MGTVEQAEALDFERQAARIRAALGEQSSLEGQLLRINRPG
jgi:hypothetical protein